VWEDSLVEDLNVVLDEVVLSIGEDAWKRKHCSDGDYSVHATYVTLSCPNIVIVDMYNEVAYVLHIFWKSWAST